MDQSVGTFEGAIRERYNALKLIAPRKRDISSHITPSLDKGIINRHYDKHGGISASKSGGHGMVNYISASSHDQDRLLDPATTAPVRQIPPPPSFMLMRTLPRPSVSGTVIDIVDTNIHKLQEG
jgi:hypothetical protein